MNAKAKHLSIAAGRAMRQPTRRDLKFDLDPDLVSNWHHAGPVFTTFLNTFSSILPVGERFFIDAVRAHRDQIDDPELAKAVRAFIGQEAMHGREHERYNGAFFDAAPSGAKLEKRVKSLLDWFTKNTPASFCLSGTIALEHFTALLADSVLTEPRLTDGADPAYAAVWHWHALEETEHKAVAFDVWRSVMGRTLGAYGLRVMGQVMATAIFWAIVFPAFLQALREEGELTNISGWAKFVRYTLGDVGLIRRQLGTYLDYYRPGFHPWDHDNSEYLEQMQTFLTEVDKLTA